MKATVACKAGSDFSSHFSFKVVFGQNASAIKMDALAS